MRMCCHMYLCCHLNRSTMKKHFGRYWYGKHAKRRRMPAEIISIWNNAYISERWWQERESFACLASAFYFLCRFCDSELSERNEGIPCECRGFSITDHQFPSNDTWGVDTEGAKSGGYIAWDDLYFCGTWRYWWSDRGSYAGFCYCICVEQILVWKELREEKP